MPSSFIWFSNSSFPNLLPLSYVYHCSTNKTFTANSAYHFNLDTLLASLSTAAATGNKEFLNTTAGATPGDALRDVRWCCLGKAGGRLTYPSCGLRFELYQFYWDMATANSPLQHTPSHSEFTENEKVSPRTIFIVVIVLVVVLAMLSSFCYLLRRKARKKNEKILLRENFGDDSVSLEGLQFDLAIIEEATNNFSHENKIGKGGFGEVYKGILPDGRHIAVKRLSTTSTQGLETMERPKTIEYIGPKFERRLFSQ